MKAQSELMGDHERAAEMTVPRFGGAAKWSVRINTMDSANALYDTISTVGTIGLNQYCLVRGIKPTIACRESGAGPNLLGNIEAGSIPSVEKVQLLAQYLGVSTSELLGERLPTVPAFPEHPDLVILYDQLFKEAQQEVMAFIEFKRTQETKAAKGSIPMEELGDTRPAGAKEMENLKKESEGKTTGDSIK